MLKANNKVSSSSIICSVLVAGCSLFRVEHCCHKFVTELK